MRTRILPPEEWPRVEHLDVGKLPSVVKPENLQIVVVEDDAGKIIATWSVLRMTHFEGFWVDPEHSKKAGAVRGLLREANRIAAEGGEAWAFTGADSDGVARYIERLGGVSLPAQFYIVPVRAF